MDFLKQVHEDLHDFIFQHLSANDLLNLSEVSVFWYEVIGKSKVFSSKVWVNVDDRFAEPCNEIVKVFKTSKRNYNNFKIYEFGNGLEIILNNRKKWKRAQINIQSFVQPIQYYKLLDMIHNIVDLKIFEMDMQEIQKTLGMKEMNKETFSFLNLKKLCFGFIPIIAIEPFINTCRNLNTIIFDDVNFKEIHNKEQLMLAFFKSQYNLKNIQIPVEALSIIIEEIDNLQFSLNIMFIDFSNEKLIDKNKFELFLLKHYEINWIKLFECSFENIIKIVLGTCKKLKRLSIEYFDNSSLKFDTQNLKNIKNTCVNQIDLEVENLNLEWTIPILSSLDALKLIYFFHLPENLLNFIVKNSQNIKIIEYCSIFNSFENLAKFDKVSLINNKNYLEESNLEKIIIF